MPDLDVMSASDPGAVADSSASDGAAGLSDTSTTDVQADAGVETTDGAIDNASLGAADQTTEIASQPAPLEIQPGQPLPQQFRNLAKHPDPEVAKLAPMVQSMYDRLQAYSSTFPSIADAKEFVQAFPGGVKDAVQAAQRAAELDESDVAFESGDPATHRALAEDWYARNPEATTTLTRQALELVAEKNPAAYQEMGETILEGTLANLYRTALGMGNKDAADRLAQLHQDVFGRRLGEQPRQDPRMLEFQQREQQIRQREADLQNRTAASFATDANAQVGKQLTSQIQANLSTALAKLKVSDGAKSRIANEIYDDINSKLIADKGLQMRLQSIAQAGRRSGFSDQHRQQWTDAIAARAKALLPSSAKSIIDRWTTDYLGVVKATNSKLTSAASRKDVGGGGLPDHSLAPLSAEQADKMTSAELMAYQGPLGPDVREKLRKMNQERFFGKPAAR